MYRRLMIHSVAAMINGRTVLGGRDLVRGVSINSKVTKPGDLFLPIKILHLKRSVMNPCSTKPSSITLRLQSRKEEERE